MLIQLYFIIAIFVIGSLLNFWFFQKKRKLESVHNKYVEKLENFILLHKNQITYREKGFNRYHFLKYNLDDALVVQPEIVLY